MGHFENASVIVTGAASGLGRATAIQFAGEGAWVLAADVDEERGRETVRLMEQAGGSGDFLRVDVSRPEDLRQAVDTAVGARSRLDVMFNNAGIVFNASILDTAEEQWDRVMAVNLKGVFFGCKFAIEQMLRQGGGIIVNTASVAGLVAGFTGQPAYIASKGGVVLLTKALAMDHAGDNIRVNCVCPGVMDTAMIDAFLASLYETEEERATAREQLHQIQPIGHMSTPEQVAKVVLFLASPAAADITGVALPVDGGFVAR